MWGDTLEDYNNKCKRHKYRCRYRAGTSSLWGIREGSLEDIRTISRYNLELTKKGQRRGNSIGNSVEMRNGRVEDMHGSQLVLDKALGENSGK